MPNDELEKEIIREWLRTRGEQLEVRIAAVVAVGNRAIVAQQAITNELLSQLLGKPVAQLSVSQQQGIPGSRSIPYSTSYFNSYITKITKANTVQKLYNSSLPSRYCTIRAFPTNSGTVLVGDDDTDPTNGFPLAKGESIDTYIDDLSKIWLWDTVLGDKVVFAYEVGQGLT